jgi:type I restriction enzyme M protein
VKNYNKTKPIRIEEFDAEKAWWGSEADGFAARVENERAWKVSIDQIKAAWLQPRPEEPPCADADQPRPRSAAGRLRPPAGEAQALRDPARRRRPPAR